MEAMETPCKQSLFSRYICFVPRKPVKFLLSMLRALLRYIFEPRLNWYSFKRPRENDVKTKAHKNGFV